jgi:hypothetical protein
MSVTMCLLILPPSTISTTSIVASSVTRTPRTKRLTSASFSSMRSICGPPPCTTSPNEIFLDVYERLASFDRGVNDFTKRLFDAYAAEVARVDQDGDGVISAVEGDVDSASDRFADNARLLLPVLAFKRFAVTREINDGYLAPRFAPSQRAWCCREA